MRVTLQIVLLPLLLCSAVAVTSSNRVAEIRNIKLVHRADRVEIDILLSEQVAPRVVVASQPYRLVLELPSTLASAKQKRISVNRNGVQNIRFGLHQDKPPVTHLVVDLDSMGSYGLSTRGKTVVLTVFRNEAATQVAKARPYRSAVSRTIAAATRIATPSRLVNRARESSKTQTEPPMPVLVTRPPAAALRPGFKIRYVTEGAAYLEGGRDCGLEEGMKLTVRDLTPQAAQSDDVFARSTTIAELEVISVASTSAVAAIHGRTADLKQGEWAYLSPADTARADAQRLVSSTREHLPPPQLEDGEPVNRFTASSGISSPLATHVAGRIGFDYSGIRSHGSTPGWSSQVGMMFRSDINHILGTHWNLQGYWRGRITKNSQPREDTLQDTLNKTYTMQLSYDNPDSNWLAGFGRLYLPWATSLDVIDGGYVGHRLRKNVIAGAFVGSTPDPASWHYAPDHQIGGAFVNYEGGSYEGLHYSSTAGAALNMIKWQVDRPYAFFENEVSFKRSISVYHSLIIDAPQGISTNGIRPGMGVSRSYLTLHYQPFQRVSFDVYHNYFRDVPTASTQLVGTGLVDKLLYQGVNFGVRVEPIRHVFLYSTIGRSDKTGDTHRSLNQMYGITWDENRYTGIRADFRYSKFDSSFGRGDYKMLSLSRHLGDKMMWDMQIGSQNLDSPFTANNKAFFVSSSFDYNLTSNMYLQSGYTTEHGSQLNYDQWYLSLGYRFGVKSAPEVK